MVVAQARASTYGPMVGVYEGDFVDGSRTGKGQLRMARWWCIHRRVEKKAGRKVEVYFLVVEPSKKAFGLVENGTSQQM